MGGEPHENTVVYILPFGVVVETADVGCSRLHKVHGLLKSAKNKGFAKGVVFYGPVFHGLSRAR